MFRRMVYGIVLTTLLTSVLFLSKVNFDGMRASFPKKSIETLKIVEGCDFGNNLNIPLQPEHGCVERGDRSITCEDENSAELVIGIEMNCYARMRDFVSRYRGRLASNFSMGGEVVALVCDLPFEAMSRFVAETRSEGLLRYIEPSVEFRASLVPDDSYRSLQWALEKIEAYAAWNVTVGNSEILVAIVDTGVDYSHVDLAQNYVALGYDWVNDDPDPMDDNGHGTHCAGIVAAGLNNSIGTAGVAQIRFFGEKGLNQHGSGYSEDLANAICHAVNQGAKIISCSWGSYEGSELIHDAIRHAHEAGALVIASAGNDAWDLENYPAAYEEVVAVASTGQSDNPTGFSNYGDWINLSAPGDLIFSTVPNSAYSYMSGTSMSAPYVAGVAALVWSQFPNMTRDQMVQQLFKTSDDLGEAGFDLHYGYGRVNARKAVEELWPKTDVLIMEWQKYTTIHCKPEETLTINATIFGFGENDENNVTSQMLVNGTIVDSKRIDLLESGESETARFHWASRTEGTYNVTVYVMPVFDENITDNNALTMMIRVSAPRLIEVGMDRRIQDAINSAYPGDTIKVEAGTYYEHLTVNKSLSLIGGSGAVIDGNGTGTVVNVLADHLNVTGFNIQNGNRGIYLNCAAKNTIADNTISNNTEGLVLFHSENNRITNNSMISNHRNFCIQGDFDKYTMSQFIQEMDASNTVDGKPVYYWVNQSNKRIPSDAGYVAIILSINITTKDVSLTKNSQGVLIAYSEGSVVENVNASQNEQGILLVGAYDCAVQSSVAANDVCGIDLRDSFNVRIAHNTVHNNTDGLSLRYSSNGILQNNAVISNHNDGIRLEYSNANEIRSNNVSSNSRGIDLAWSGSSILRDNNLTNNTHNFGIAGDCLQDFILDIDTSNTVEGKLIYYLINKRNLIIDPSTSPNAGYLAVVNCTNLTVEDLYLTGNSQGVLLAYTSNSTVQKVGASNNSDGIYLFNCNENIVQGNVINNSTTGIALHSSADNDVAGNTVTASEGCGIYLGSSSNNKIRDNTFSESRWGSGVAIEDSSRYNSFIRNTVERNLIGIFLGVNEPHDNEIYYNNFVHNTNQLLRWISFWTKINTWNDGKHQGNYWSDYKGEDSNRDGIGDTLLPHLDIDNYPLMTRFWNESDINHDGKVDILDISIVAKAFGSTAGQINWNKKGDLDNNGVVDILDVSLAASQYRKTA